MYILIYRSTLAMGFIVMDSPRILLRNLKCGLKIGVDGRSYLFDQLDMI